MKKLKKNLNIYCKLKQKKEKKGNEKKKKKKKEAGWAGMWWGEEFKYKDIFVLSHSMSSISIRVVIWTIR